MVYVRLEPPKFESHPWQHEEAASKMWLPATVRLDVDVTQAASMCSECLLQCRMHISREVSSE